MTEAARLTAEFIENMDKLFNAFNSKTIASTAQMRHVISQTSGHNEFLEQMLSWLKDVKTKGNILLKCKYFHDWFDEQIINF
jgi:hypothetical protein